MQADESKKGRAGGLPYEFTHFNGAYFGFALVPTWVYCLLHTHTIQSDGSNLTVLFYLMLAAGMLLFIALRFGFKIRSISQALLWPAAVAASCAACFLGFPFTFSDEVYGGVTVIGGIAAAWMYLAWAPFYKELDVRDAVACGFGSMAISSAIKLIAVFLPEAALGVLLVALPLCGPILIQIAERNQPPVPVQPQIYFSSARSSFPYVILIGVAACSFIIGVAPQVAPEVGGEFSSFYRVFQHILEIASALMIIWWVFLFEGKLHFTNMWRVIVIFVATALLFLPNLDTDNTGLVLVLVAVSQTMLVWVIWTMLADAAHHSSASPYVVFGFAWVAYALPLAAGQYAGVILAEQSNVGFLVAVLSYALTVTAILTLNDRNFIENRVFRDLDIVLPEAASAESFDSKCEKLGIECGLTGREIEVLKLLCLGRSKNYIAETLFISENTVRSHSRHIYQKLDVHSRQEILDLLTVDAQAQE